MSTIQNRAKVIPNRLVLKHEEYLINKSLSTKVRNVKSTIHADNKNFERVIITRQKRDSVQPTLQKYKSFDDPFSSENSSKGKPENDHHLPVKEFRVKTTDPFPGRIQRDSLMSPPYRNTKEGYPSGRTGTGSYFSSPRGVFGIPLTKSSTHGPSNSQGGVLLVNIGSSNHDKILSGRNSEVEILKDQLVEKDMELKYLKDELKDWWHDDLKKGKSVQFKENLVNNEQNNQNIRVTSPDRNEEQKLRNFKQRGGKSTGASFTIKNSKKSIVPQSLEHNKFKEMQIAPVQYHNSLKILEKFESIEKSKKKLEPLNISKEGEMLKKEDDKRPNSVKQKKSRNSEKFKLRFSNVMEHGSLKTNTRYQSQDVEAIEETIEPEKEEKGQKEQKENEEYENIEEEIERFEEKEPAPVFKPKAVKNRYQQKEEEEDEEIEDDVFEPESPVIAKTSKDLLIQSRTLNSRSYQQPNSFRYDEFLLE